MSPDRAPKTRRSPAWPMRPTWRSLRRAAGSWPGRWRATLGPPGTGCAGGPGPGRPGYSTGRGRGRSRAARSGRAWHRHGCSHHGRDRHWPPPGAATDEPCTGERPDAGTTHDEQATGGDRSLLRPSRRRSDPMAPWPVRLGPANGRTIPSRIAGRIGMATSGRATSGLARSRRPPPRGIPLITAGRASRSKMAPTRSGRTAPSPTCCRP